MKKEMFYSAGNLVFQNAKYLRRRPTDAERMLWSIYEQGLKDISSEGSILQEILFLISIPMR